ncbi:TIGR03089 family protein [Actinoplanes sp. NPDC051851]|uniref:TIGR03089 family protein n=1 Tax=Actinoplanes sp. NPDC051851 TaxID=3154753 RepID=UPI00342FB64B
MNTTLPQVLAEAVRRDPATPLLTFYDDVSGDRTELSGATLDNWVSKTANLLVDGAGLGHGDNVALVMPPHWQTAAILLGAAAAGLATDLADLGGDPQPVEALFTTPDLVERAAAWSATDRYATGLLPLAMPLRELPAGYADFVTEVRNYGDHFRGEPVSPADRVFAGPIELSHADALAGAEDRATQLGFGAGDRVMFDLAIHPDPVDWLLAPLLVGASVVLCANLDHDRIDARAVTEKVSLVLS